LEQAIEGYCRRYKGLFPGIANLAPLAIRWILDHPEFSTIIPGASKPEHLESNLKATSLPRMTEDQSKGIDGIYNEKNKPLVNHLW